MSGNSVVGWLQSAGLERYAPAFEVLSEDAFLKLLMQDYGKFGVTDMDDKQRLFRLIKSVSNDRRDNVASTTGPPSRERGSGMGVGGYGTAPGGVGSLGGVLDHHVDGSGGLLDLEADDGDLLITAAGSPYEGTPMQSNGTVQVATPEAVPPVYEEPPKIRVVVRKRPLNRKERERGEDDVIEVDMERQVLHVNEPRVRVDLVRYTERHQFNFDVALDESVQNDAVYSMTVQPLVQTVFWGGKATCFAYGQTGSGKTYTMSPLPLKTAEDIFMMLAQPGREDVFLHVSCFEIYGGKIFDLLNGRKKLEIREDSKKKVVVVGLKEYVADSVQFIEQLIDHSAAARSTGTTGANADSSRSHAIMQFAIKQQMDDNKQKLVGKISFIDLAGSERGADTFDNNRQTRLEGAEINKSLLALKECIRALDSDARHVPFRGSKLTAVLRDSFIGKEARTVMIANVSPNSTSVEHTLNTLRYADRVKELRKDKAERTASMVTPSTQALLAQQQQQQQLQQQQQQQQQLQQHQQQQQLQQMLQQQQYQLVQQQLLQQQQQMLQQQPPQLPGRPPLAEPFAPSPERPSEAYNGSQSNVAGPADGSRTNNSVGAGDGYRASSAVAGDGYRGANSVSASDGHQFNPPGGMEMDDGPYQEQPDSRNLYPPPQPYQPQREVRDSAAYQRDNSISYHRDSNTYQRDGSQRVQDSELLAQRDELMNSILEDEEQLISAHRALIEESMEVVRQEMTLLSEVDQPGSAIDQYVEQMDNILEQKLAMIQQMAARVDAFKQKLKEEEALSRTIGRRRLRP